MSKIEVQTIDSPSGQNTVTIGDSNASTITLKSGATLTNFPANTPAFFTYLTNNQDIPDDTWTKVSGFTELLDTDSCFASNKFTPTTAGKYIIYVSADVGSVGTATNLREAYSAIYKNGSFYAFSDNNYNGSFIYNTTIFTQTVVDFNGSTDYVEFYAYGNLTTGNPRVYGGGNKQTFFGGYRIIGA